MLQKICLRIIYNDKQSFFTELLNKDSSVSIQITNIPRLTIEKFKALCYLQFLKNTKYIRIVLNRF